MSTNTVLQDDFMTYAVDLQDFTDTQAREVIKTFEQMEQDLIKELQTTDLTEFNRERLNALRKSTRATIDRYYGRMASDNNSDLTRIAGVAQKQVKKSIDGVVGGDITSISLAPSRLRAIVDGTLFNGASSKEWWWVQKTNMRDEFEKIVRNGMIRGETTQQITRQVRDRLKLDRNSADALTRTSIIAVNNDATLATYADNKDIIKGIQWISTLDSRTTHICFTGETKFLPCGKLERVFRRKYEGNIIIIRTSTCEQISTTPNHPILTSEGWRIADELEPGKHVLYGVGSYGLCVECANTINVPTFAEFFNAFSQMSCVDVSSERASAHDFHGDVTSGDSYVDVATFKESLIPDVVPSGYESIAYNTFGNVGDAVDFSSFSCLFKLFFRGFPTVHTSTFESFFFENAVKPSLRNAELGVNLARSLTSAEQLDSTFRYKLGFGITSASDGVSYTESGKEGSHSCNAGVVLPCQVCGARSVQVRGSDIVSIRREFKSCHVYNLQSDTGLYHVPGVVVKNCKSLDGLVWKVPDNYREYNKYSGIGHNVKFPGNTAHWRCRSAQTPVLKDWRAIGFEFDLSESTRASMDGQVPETLNYSSWLRTKPEAFQKAVLGLGRWRLWNQGKLELVEMINRQGQPLTLAELEAKVNDGIPASVINDEALYAETLPTDAEMSDPTYHMDKAETWLSDNEHENGIVRGQKALADLQSKYDATVARGQEVFKEMASATGAKLKDLEKEFDSLGNEQVRLFDEITANIERRVKSVQDILDALLFRTSADDIKRMIAEQEYRFEGISDDVLRSYVTPNLERFTALTGGRGLDRVNVFTSKTVRGFYNIETGTVGFGNDLRPTTLLHEMGHAFEHSDSRLETAAYCFLLNRNRDRGLAPLSELMGNTSYGNEVAFKDEFFSHYVGRTYTTGKQGPTEVISMGLQQFTTAEDLVELIDADYEHFLFILGLLL